MRQAVVTVDPDFLTDRGFQFEVFQDACVLDTQILSCEGPRGVLRIRVEEQLDTRRLDAMDAIQWWEQVSNERSGYVYLIEAKNTEVRDETSTDGDRFPRCEQLTVTDQGVTITWAGPQDRLREEFVGLEAAGNDVTLEQLRAIGLRRNHLMH